MKNELEFTKDLARRAGEMLLDGWKSFDQLTDKDDGEVVTDLDKKINTFILEEIQAQYPDDAILSEEDDPVEKEGDARLWVVDPIDGTVNMTRGIPHFCVSIGMWHNGEPQVGVVFDPIHDELFSAIAGGSVQLNDTDIEVSDMELDEGLLLYAHSYSNEKNIAGRKKIASLLDETGSDRRLGSAALMLCYVACGRAEALVITDTKPWDCAAGVLMVRAAGGKVTDFEGDAWKLSEKTILASNKKVHKKVLEELDD